MAKFEMIPCVDACNFPRDVEDWFDENEMTTHCDDSLIFVDDEITEKT